MSDTQTRPKLVLPVLPQKVEDQGKTYWRSLEEQADSADFRRLFDREFAEGATEWTDRSSRRRFLQLMGASIALAGVNGCYLKPEEKLVPYVRRPEEFTAGVPLHYATSFPWNGSAVGLLIESHMGRPTKVEGNPLHPASLGASGIFEQASLLTLYDPDRSQTNKSGRQIASWNSFLTSFQPHLDQQQAKQGKGLRILTESVCSPTLRGELHAVLKAYPQARVVTYDAVTRDHEERGLRAVFGTDVQPVIDLRRADVILSLDADFLAEGPGQLRHAREFAARRRLDAKQPVRTEMSRLYQFETTPTLTGAAADHRWALDSSGVLAVAAAIAQELGVPVDQVPARPASVSSEAIQAIVDDLKSYRLRAGDGAPLVVAGPWQPPEVHALVHAMNVKLGAVGKSIQYVAADRMASAGQLADLKELVDEMRQGQVDVLLILGGNPIFNAPADLEFGAALDRVPFRVHLSLYDDETSAVCHWHLAEAHYLESWGDGTAYDGTASIQQPLIAPLYDGHSSLELLAVVLGQPGSKPYDLVRRQWQSARPTIDSSSPPAQAEATAADRSGTAVPTEATVPPPAGSDSSFEDWWERSVHDGVISGSTAPAVEVAIQSDFRVELPAVQPASDTSLELVFRPDPTIWDGRFANHGWLQELPKPFSQLTWDNAALISPRTAESLGLKLASSLSDLNRPEQEIVRLQVGGRSIEIPVWIVPGVPDATVTVHFGYGRQRVGNVGQGHGTDVYPLRTVGSPWFARGAKLERTGRTYPLATTQHHSVMEGRHLVRSGTLAEFQAHPEHPEFVHPGHHAPEASFYPPLPYDGYKWGMSINLGSCIGCSACVIACQAENNIPVVGKDEVMRGREMHWIRVDRYYEGPLDQPATHFQPVPCMHCENAPCEPVCPVAATTHSSEGINEMTYNRCVGTRYCANNCPYKVRRFNFFHYTSTVEASPTLQMLQNPDVTVRSRGVMEKCTFCVQRVNEQRVVAERDGRTLRDGDVLTACQQACPTQAIVFGDLNDPTSQISQAKKLPLDYALLGELNTRPRTTYLASLRNPHPKLQSVEHHDHVH
jgi:MoCo/4Fe-4S cofactor protein with predicted Tat translocation signal